MHFCRAQWGAQILCLLGQETLPPSAIVSSLWVQKTLHYHLYIIFSHSYLWHVQHSLRFDLPLPFFLPGLLLLCTICISRHSPREFKLQQGYDAHAHEWPILLCQESMIKWGKKVRQSCLQKRDTDLPGTRSSTRRPTPSTSSVLWSVA